MSTEAEQVTEQPADEKKSGLFGVAGTVCAFIVIAEIIAAAFLFLTGATTVDKMIGGFKAMIAKKKKPEVAEEKIEGPFTGVTTSLELADAVKKAQEDFSSREAKLSKRQEELRQLKSEFTRFQGEVKSDRAELKNVREQFEAQLKAYLDRAQAKGFEEAVAVYQKMGPEDVAAILLGKPEEDILKVVELMRAFKSSFIAEVLTEMKRLEEEKSQTAGETRAARILALIRSGEPKVASPLAPGEATE